MATAKQNFFYRKFGTDAANAASATTAWYTGLGVTGVTADTLAIVKERTASVWASAANADSAVANLQPVATAAAKLMALANGSVADVAANALVAADLTALGVTTTATDLSLLNAYLGANTNSAVNTIAKVQAIATATANLEAAMGSGAPGALTTADLAALNITGTADLDLVAHALNGNSATATAPSAIQAIVTAAQQAMAVVAAYANNDGAATSDFPAPTLDTLKALGFANATATHLNRLMVRLASADVVLGKADTFSEIAAYVADTTAPVFAAATASVDFAENATGTVYTAAATDNLAVTGYSLAGADAAKFAIDAATGAVTFVAAPDFETPSSAASSNAYTIDIVAKDEAGNEATQTVTINVTNANEAPTAVGTPAAQVAAVGTAFEGIDVSTFFDDVDANDEVTYTITDGSLPKGLTLNPGTGVISGTATEAAVAADVTITATDAGGLSVTQTFNFAANISTKVTGQVMLGALSVDQFIQGNILGVEVYDENNQLIGSSKIDINGNYDIDLGHYTGLALVSLLNPDTRPDYYDDASRELTDISSPIRELIDIKRGENIANLTNATELATRITLEQQTTDENLMILTGMDVNIGKSKVIKHFNLNNEDWTNEIISILDENRELQISSVNRYGLMLAQISAKSAETQKTNSQVLNDLVNLLIDENLEKVQIEKALMLNALNEIFDLENGLVDRFYIGDSLTLKQLKPLYVLAGQSNADFVERSNALPQYLIDNGINADILNVVKGGTRMGPNLRDLDWYPFEDYNDKTGELFNQLISGIKEKLASDPSLYLAKVFYIQGESDALTGDNHHLTYGENLNKLIDTIDENFGLNYQFVISRLSTKSGWFYGSKEQVTVQKAQDDTALQRNNVILFNPDQLIDELQLTNPFRDNIHFSEAVHIEIGKALMNASIIFDEKNEYIWDKIIPQYTENGDLLSSTIYFDNGKVNSYLHKPVISSAYIEPGNYNYADVIAVHLSTENNRSGFTLGEHQLNDLALIDFIDNQNGTYTVKFQISNHEKYRYNENINFNFSLIDGDGNEGPVFTESILQNVTINGGGAAVLSAKIYSDSPSKMGVIPGDIITLEFTTNDLQAGLPRVTINGISQEVISKSINNSYYVNYEITLDDVLQANGNPIRFIIIPTDAFGAGVSTDFTTDKSEIFIEDKILIGNVLAEESFGYLNFLKFKDENSNTRTFGFLDRNYNGIIDQDDKLTHTSLDNLFASGFDTNDNLLRRIYKADNGLTVKLLSIDEMMDVASIVNEYQLTDEDFFWSASSSSAETHKALNLVTESIFEFDDEISAYTFFEIIKNEAASEPEYSSDVEAAWAKIGNYREEVLNPAPNLNDYQLVGLNALSSYQDVWSMNIALASSVSALPLTIDLLNNIYSGLPSSEILLGDELLGGRLIGRAQFVLNNVIQTYYHYDRNDDGTSNFDSISLSQLQQISLSPEIPISQNRVSNLFALNNGDLLSIPEFGRNPAFSDNVHLPIQNQNLMTGLYALRDAYTDSASSPLLLENFAAGFYLSSSENSTSTDASNRLNYALRLDNGGRNAYDDAFKGQILFQYFSSSSTFMESIKNWGSSVSRASPPDINTFINAGLTNILPSEVQSFTVMLSTLSVDQFDTPSELAVLYGSHIPAVIDMSSDWGGGQLINPFSFISDGLIKTYYIFDADNSMSINNIDRVSFDQIEDFMNIPSIDALNRSYIMPDGTQIKLALLGTNTHAEVGSPFENQNDNGLRSIYDANTPSDTSFPGIASPELWKNATYWSADGDGSGSHYRFNFANGGFGLSLDSVKLFAAFEVIPG